MLELSLARELVLGPDVAARLAAVDCANLVDVGFAEYRMPVGELDDLPCSEFRWLYGSCPPRLKVSLLLCLLSTEPTPFFSSLIAVPKLTSVFCLFGFDLTIRSMRLDCTFYLLENIH